MVSSDSPVPTLGARLRLRREAVLNSDAWAAARENAPLLVVCLGLLVFGVVLRIQNLGFPAHLTWDEDHFVTNAQNYLAGKPDVNDHPPLGKVFMAAAMWVVGDNPVGWRLAQLVAGLLNIALGYSLARTLFKDRIAGWMAAAFLAADGFLLSYSRTALLDGMLTTFMLAIALTALHARRARHMLLGAVLLGCAVSIKISGIVMVMPLLATIVLGRVRLWTVLILALVPLIFYANFALAHAWAGKPWDPFSVYQTNVDLVHGHMRANKMAHPRSSHWYTWLVPIRPVTLRVDVIREPLIRALSSIGNPLLWWSTTLACVGGALGLLVLAVRRVFARVRHRAAPTQGLFSDQAGALTWGIFFWCLPMLPWIVSSRDSYIYHYLPAYAFGLVVLAGCATWLYRRWRTTVFVGMLLVVQVTAFYAPVWGQLPVTRLGLQDRLFIQSWR